MYFGQTQVVGLRGKKLSETVWMYTKIDEIV